MVKFALQYLSPALRGATIAKVRQLQRNLIGSGVRFVSRQNGAFYLDTPDRMVLENQIFPFYQISADHTDMLFIGCDWYTEGYARRFRHKNYCTLDADPAKARFGSQNHLTAPMQNLGAAHHNASLDLIICNGIIGWGLDDIRDAEASFAAAFEALRPGGHLIVGWNDVEPHRPFTPADLHALKPFDALVFPPLGVDQVRVDHKMQHVFEFYAKPSAAITPAA